MTKDEALRMALEALDRVMRHGSAVQEAKDILQAALSEPEQEWQGLTEEDIHHAFCHTEYTTFNDWSKDPEGWCIENARYLEAILKEKNSASPQRKPPTA